MRRRALEAVLLASGLGSVCVWAVVLSTVPRMRVREASNRLVAAAQEAAGNRDAAASRQLVDQALAMDPDSPRARRELAMHLLARGSLDAGIVELRRVAVADRSNGGAARELAAILYWRRNLKEALYWLREAAKREPDSGLPYVGIAQCLVETDDPAGAVRAAERAVMLSPRYQPAYAVLGSARRKSGDLTGARAAFDNAIQLRPSDLATLLAAATVASDMGLDDAALGYARRAANVDTDSRLALLVLAQILADSGRAAEARQVLSRARDLHRSDGAPTGSSRRAHPELEP